MNIKINDSFLKELENFSDEEDNIFQNDSTNNNPKDKIVEKDSILKINLNDDKLLNSTKLKNNKRFHEYLKELEVDINKSNSNPSILKSQNFKNTNA